MKVNGMEVEFNIFDADVMEKVTKSVEKVQEELTSVGNVEGEANQIRSMCQSIKVFIDETIEPGKGVEFCGEANDLLKHIDVYEAVIGEIVRQRKALEERTKKLQTKYNVKK